jgi:hypothetical protein
LNPPDPASLVMEESADKDNRMEEEMKITTAD